MEYSITLRRTRIILEQVTIDTSSNNLEGAIETALASDIPDVKWNRQSTEQVLINIGDHPDLKHINYMQASAKAILEGNI